MASPATHRQFVVMNEHPNAKVEEICAVIAHLEEMLDALSQTAWTCAHKVCMKDVWEVQNLMCIQRRPTGQKQRTRRTHNGTDLTERGRAGATALPDYSGKSA
ncbi:unnamed protein product [Ostreobium quekettii]|uniref:Uncharacterized protein n=1 Tax=Ostreobium quekettii TaxID=121088 RepID=A0A8S1IV06_9CHLO|nr:unnamed protein product [Ostreobium quekettii]|eukprot:evm.model.scf_139.10 EVM.evm.TU.scf_139.10   scf_139:106863-107171(-)